MSKRKTIAIIRGGLCSAPLQFKHFDELLADIGDTEVKRNMFAEQFKFPQATAYGRFLKSAPQFQVE
jgi:hypothetical protein